MRTSGRWVILLVLLLGTPAGADIVLYRVPGSNLVFILEGSSNANPGRTLSFRHRLGNLYLGLDDVKVFELPPTRTLAERKRQRAEQQGDVEACLESGRWALHNGLLPEFYQAASAAWRIDPDHPSVKRLVSLKKKMGTPPSNSAEQEKALRQFVQRSDMKLAKSNHFLLLHDTSDKKGPSRKTRAQERLDLLETVYESFLIKFCLEGVELEVPQQFLQVVLFSEKKDYLQFVDRLSPSLKKASGFYHREHNIAVFYDQGTDESFAALYELNSQLQKEKDRILRQRLRGARDVVRLADTIQLLTEVARENLDIEVVTHEATHQMAGNTGLMPGHAPVPVWAAEGLATFFESPKQAAWSGIGSVNEERLQWYRALEPDRRFSNIDFIVSDRIFTTAASGGAQLHGYGQAWALTHFLMDRHLDKLIQWYRVIANQPTRQPLNSDQLLESFNQVFGKDKTALDQEWRAYMRSLKTDLQLVLEEQKE